MMNDHGNVILAWSSRIAGAGLGDILHFAVARNDMKRVKELMASGSDINAEQCNYTPVHISLILGHDDISLFLLGHPKLDRKSLRSLSWSCLNATVERSSIEVIKTLLENVVTCKDTIQLFIKAACYKNHVGLIKMFIESPKLAPHFHWTRRSQLYTDVCNKNAFSLLKFLKARNIVDSVQTEVEIWIEAVCTQGNRNMLRYIFRNWDVITNGCDMPIVLQNIVRWILSDDVPLDSFIECLEHCTDNTIHIVSRTFQAHELCTRKSDIAYVYLDRLERIVSPLWIHWIHELLQHKLQCAWYQPKFIVSKLISLWRKAFAQYKLLYCMLWYFSPSTRIYPLQIIVKWLDEWWKKTEINCIINMYQRLLDANHNVDRVTNALYYAIYYNQIWQVKSLMQNMCVDEKMLTTAIPGRQISLIQLASQNETVLNVLTGNCDIVNVDTITHPYIEWYKLLDHISSSPPLPYYKHSESQQNREHPVSQTETIQKLNHIYCTFDEYKSKKHVKRLMENQTVFNAVRRIFHEIVIEMERLDPLFRCSPEFVGSSREGTRAFMPDEFDVKFLCHEIKQYIEIIPPSFEIQLSAVLRLLVRNQYRTCNEIKPYLLENGDFDVELFKVKFDSLLEKSIITIFKQRKVCQYLVLEPQFARYTNITNVRIKWRGTYYKDMTITIDVVPAILCEQPYSLFCPRLDNNKFYVFFKFKIKGSSPVDHSDVELKSLCRLPIEVRKGYAFAKAIRLSSILPPLFLARHRVSDIHDCLRTYLLKVCLLFCTERLCILHPSYAFGHLRPMEWAYLLYNHLEARLLEGEIPIWFSVDPNFVTRLWTETVFQCYHSLDVPPDEEAPCCTKQKALLALTRFFIDALKAFCEHKGCNMDALEDRVKQIRQTEIPGLQEVIRVYIQGKRPAHRAIRSSNCKTATKDLVPLRRKSTRLQTFLGKI